MSTGRIKHSKGFSLIEVMVAILILSVAVIGTSGYRYYTALDARKADMQATAARVALMLCESWRGVKGDENYDPTSHFGSELQITTIADSDIIYVAPNGFTALGYYQILLNNFPCHMTMSWQDVSSGLRALNVIVAWPQRASYNQSYVLSDDTSEKTFRLTTYVQT